MNSTRLEVLNPVADTLARAVGTVPRPRDLSNRRLALYWNLKPNGDVALMRAAEHLRRRYTNLQCDLIAGSRPATKDKLDEVKRHDIVLSATGD